MKESITLKFPISHMPEQFVALQALNQDVQIQPNKKGNQITFHESAFAFEGVSFFHLQLPTDFVITEEQFEEICSINKTAKLEFDDYNQLTINMFTAAMISAFTALVITTLINWVRTNRKGRVYDATARFDLRDSAEKLKRRAADASFLSYSSAASEVQNSWKFIQLPPDLAIEIVSASKDEQKEIDKMRKDWLEGGAKVGIVVNPHKKKYYIFEQGDIGYEIYDFSTPFAHRLFSGLVIKFDDLLEEAIEQSY